MGYGLISNIQDVPRRVAIPHLRLYWFLKPESLQNRYQGARWASLKQAVQGVRLGSQ